MSVIGQTTSTKVQACRICLAMGSKLFNIEKHNLKSYYENIMGIMITPQDKLPQQLCWECAHRLIACMQFKKKALRCHNLMTESLSIGTQPNITLKDRKLNYLLTTLSCKYYEPNHNDVFIAESSQPENKHYIFNNIVKIEYADNIDTDNSIGTVNNDSDIFAKSDLDVDQNDAQDIQLKDENESENNAIFVQNYLEDSHPNDVQRILLKVENENYGMVDESSPNLVSKVKRASKPRNKSETVKKRKKNKIDRRRKPVDEGINKEIFDITDLPQEEQLLNIQKRKESANYKHSAFKCDVCFKGFTDEDAYKGHMSRHTDQAGAYECGVCKIRFKKKQTMRYHTTLHMQKFSCKMCPYVTSRKAPAKLHEKFHDGTTYSCPHCTEVFLKVSTYLSHVRIKHPSDIVCPVCGYSFVSAKGLDLHKKLKHRLDNCTVPDNGPLCIECDVRFVTEQAMERHLKLSTKHNGEKESERKRAHKKTGKESRCKEKNDTEVKKKKKRHRHKPEGPIVCEQCDMELPNSASYYRHFRRLHPDKNRTNYPWKGKCMCEVCGKMFQSLALLQDHSSVHAESRQFSCSTCGKTFQRKYRLVAHARVHSGSRTKHACNVCGKFFTNTGNLQRHMFSHTGLRPFKCEMCGKCFQTIGEKRVHITYVHLKKPWPKRTRGSRASGRTDKQATIVSHSTTSVNSEELDLVQPLWPASNDPKISSVISE